MFLPPKNCYRSSRYFYSFVCFGATLVLLAIAFSSGVFENHFVFSIPLLVICVFFCMTGIIKGIRAYLFRKQCFMIKTHGKKYKGIVKNYHCRKAMADEKSSDAYSFLVSYFNSAENIQKEFWTPVVDFCPFNTKRIECVVYEYNGDAYAEDFNGWERKGDTNITSELSSWLPIIIVVTILIILYFIMN